MSQRATLLTLNFRYAKSWWRYEYDRDNSIRIFHSCLDTFEPEWFEVDYKECVKCHSKLDQLPRALTVDYIGELSLYWNNPQPPPFDADVHLDDIGYKYIKTDHEELEIIYHTSPFGGLHPSYIFNGEETLLQLKEGKCSVCNQQGVGPEVRNFFRAKHMFGQ